MRTELNITAYQLIDYVFSFDMIHLGDDWSNAFIDFPEKDMIIKIPDLQQPFICDHDWFRMNVDNLYDVNIQTIIVEENINNMSKLVASLKNRTEFIILKKKNHNDE